MVKLVVAYRKPDDTAAFDEHYAQVHVPLAMKIPNVRRFEAGKVLGTPDGSDAPYYFLAELWFDDGDSLKASMGTAAGRETGADVAHFATGGATMMVVDI